MKIVLAIVAALLWQTGGSGTQGLLQPAGLPAQPAAETQHLRYARALEVPAGASGVACAVLDAKVYAHAGSWSEGDLRVFRSADGKTQEEIPFAVSYSAAQPTDAVVATVQDLKLQNGVIAFDLVMPQRAYTVVDLQLAAENFLATAEVSGSDGKGGPEKQLGSAKPLGTFALFDLTQEHLARSTSMALQESSFARLHVRLRMRRLDGGAFPHLSAAVVEGATVPASREAQTLYTVVATGGKMTHDGALTVAQIEAPAHVPIERVSFVLDPAYTSDFLRKVSIVADREGLKPSPEERIDGEIWRVTRKSGGEEMPAIHDAKMAVMAVIASNVRESAMVRVQVENGGPLPSAVLPIRAIQLEMRQRTVCFDALAGARYTLRYGDDGLHASVYDSDGDFDGLSKVPVVAALGPEVLNPYYVKRSDVRRYDERNPEMYWVLLLAGISVLGALASRQTKRQGKHR